LTTIGIFVATYFLLYWSYFESDYTEFRRSFPYFGLSTLWGGQGDRKLLLMLSRIKAPYNADYTIFSWDNFFKVLNYLFHYSAFCFFLPVILLIQNRFRDLKDPRVVFLGISFLAYLVLLILLRVGFYTPLRDWDLFAVLSIAGGLLTYALLVNRRERRALILITLVNLLHTIPWIGVNHFTDIYNLEAW
jgi:hypothetical protein